MSKPEDTPEGEGLDLYDDKVQQGISWAMRRWGETLGLTTWTQGDGSESVEGDVGAEIHTILVDAGLRCPETNAMATLAAPALAAIADERRRQVEVEGWTVEHDDDHPDGALAQAAAAYAVNATAPSSQIDIKVGRRGQWFNGGWCGLPTLIWPPSWSKEWWKPKNPRYDLVRAGALIVAEIERLDRAAAVAADDAEAPAA